MSRPPFTAPVPLLALLAALGLHAVLALCWLAWPTPQPQALKPSVAAPLAVQTRPLNTARTEAPPQTPGGTAKPPPASSASPAPGVHRQALIAAQPEALPLETVPASAPDSAAFQNLNPPRYQAAPALHWEYRLQQSDQEGWARLQWQNKSAEDGRYQARLQRELQGRPLPAWRSEGGFDALGLAPSRFAEQRRERDSQAINFRREQGLISFSASREQVPLTPGAQDRLSWMMQLAALLQAEPALRQPGQRISLAVAGTRGTVSDWVFEVLGREDLLLPVGPVSGALHLRREPSTLYEPRVDVWLDPARHHLPVRLQHSQGEQLRWVLELQTELLQAQAAAP